MYTATPHTAPSSPMAPLQDHNHRCTQRTGAIGATARLARSQMASCHMCARAAACTHVRDLQGHAHALPSAFRHRLAHAHALKVARVRPAKRATRPRPRPPRTRAAWLLRAAPLCSSARSPEPWLMSCNARASAPSPPCSIAFACRRLRASPSAHRAPARVWWSILRRLDDMDRTRHRSARPTTLKCRRRS